MSDFEIYNNIRVMCGNTGMTRGDLVVPLYVRIAEEYGLVPSAYWRMYSPDDYLEEAREANHFSGVVAEEMNKLAYWQPWSDLLWFIQAPRNAIFCFINNSHAEYIPQEYDLIKQLRYGNPILAVTFIKKDEVKLCQREIPETQIRMSI